MKWALLALAAGSMIVCWQLGQPIRFNGAMNAGAGEVAFAVASPAYVGMVMAGLIGVMSVIGAALIQVSENKRKE